ncbi:IS701 family transposase, partial [Xanthomonas oryzae pv. oryzae]
VSWRQGSDATLSSRFAAVRVRAAHNRQAHDEQWLLIEWPPGESEPRHYWFSTLPKQTPVKTLECNVTIPTRLPRWPSDWLGLSPEASHTARVAGSHRTNGFGFSNTVEIGRAIGNCHWRSRG